MTAPNFIPRYAGVYISSGASRRFILGVFDDASSRLPKSLQPISAHDSAVSRQGSGGVDALGKDCSVAHVPKMTDGADDDDRQGSAPHAG